MSATYVPGSTVRLLVVFTNGGTNYDPATVVFQAIGPNSRTIITPSVVKDATGSYHADLVVNDPGLWSYRVASTGPASAAEGSFVVSPSPFVT